MPVTLSNGTRIGPYEITGPLGAGGMGEVYLALDTKLKRQVALKVLHPALAPDADRAGRFQREGELLASLNHQNIASVYGVEDSEGVRALVLEFVDGPTLADRIASGPIALDEALAIARQIADALAAAHQHGIVHRDLKPANIKVRSDGTVKVLDFGLAKLLPLGHFDGAASLSPTITHAPVTHAGVIIGTVAYMSPEQAKGHAVDAQADIWALGCVLYEMLTGQPAFARHAIAETLARIIDADPAWDALPADTPPAMRRLLRRCLEKDPKRRFHAAADVRIAIEDASITGTATASLTPSPRHNLRIAAAWLVVSAAIVITVVLAWTVGRNRSDLALLRLDVNTAPTKDPVSFALSPDGRALVFVALAQQTPQLWLRQLDQTEPRLLAGTEGASLPFWAPNGRSIGFFADGWLKRIDLTGGRPQLLAQARNAIGGSWNRDDVIVYSPNAGSPLMRVPAKGGTSTAITRLLDGEVSHRSPSFLPDGDRFLFVVLTGAQQGQGVHLGSLSSSAPDARRRLIAVGAAAAFIDGYLLMVRDGDLIAVPFDVRRGTVSGDPVTLAIKVANDESRQRGAFTVSASGLIAYRTTGTMVATTELRWIQRDGRTVGVLPAQGYPTLTADGQRVALSYRTASRTASDTQIWVLDTRDGARRQFTFQGAFELSPVWTADGSSILFASNRKGVFDLFEKPANFARDERILLETAENKFPMDTSPDGSVLLFVKEDPVTGDDLWTLSLGEPRRIVPVLTGSQAESQGQFSPDGRWLAYRSNESGRWEVYLRRYPGPGSQQLVSKNGGIQPRWRRDGKELYYIEGNARLMAVPIDLPSDGDVSQIGTAAPLFAVELASPGNQQFGYAVHPTGQRFLMWTAADRTTTTPITVLQNWAGASSR